MNCVPFWTDDYPRPADLPVSPLPARVDVAIVGGGYTGLSAARVLARSGARVAVLEQHTIGWGASSRNGGMATTGIKAAARVMVERYGRQLGHAFWQASLDAIDLIGEIVAEEAIDCHFHRPGHAQLAAKPSHYEAMIARVNWFQQELNYPLRLLPPAELRSAIGSDAFYGAIVDDWSAGLHPARYVFGLARAAARHGACLCENAAVSRIEKGSRGFVVHSAQGSLAATEVLVATNGYTGDLLPALRSRVFPGGSYIVVTEPLPPDLQAELIPHGRMLYDSRWFLNYFRLTPDGRLLFGGRNNLSAHLDLQESARRLRARMLQVYPQLRDVAITHTWTGQLGLTFDLMPHIGRLDGVHYALGYCGHGVSIATYVGAEAGLLLSGQKPGSPFMDIPHQTMFFYRRRPWFLPLAALYYRLRDWLS